MALALYRRYRPDTFDGVIGQDQVTVPLMRALDENKLTHAYLFSGPRGCGKTSSARILARCVNCAKGPTSHPCGECASCRDLATGGPGSIDVVEIDAASHNGVDDARELRERAGFAPARDRYKIFILDEAHMVTPQGFNALLKIVEEPPEHVMFIFATTEPDKVIGTIRSRTHHYPFRLVPQEVMGPYLEQICADEHIEAEAGVLRLAMRAGGGSVRDTLSVLDQLMVGAVDGKIPYDSAVALLGFTPDALIGEAIDAVADKNGEALYGVIQKVVVGGFDPRRFVEDLLARVRDLLVLTLGGERAESVLSDDTATENMDDLHRQAASLGLAALTQMADTINATLANMTGAISPRMRLELLAARLLAGRETGVVAQAAAPSSGMPEAGHAGGAAASESQRPSGSRRYAAQSARGRHAVEPSAASTNPADAVVSGAASVLAEVQQAMGGPLSEGSEPAASAESKPVETQSAPSKLSNAEASAPTQSVAQSAPQPAATDDRTPDQKWDAIVAGLPEDVRRYVDREKVPRVLLDGAKGRLWIKFDKSLSKYAFAKAVAKEAVDGTTNVVQIVRGEVHKVFGPDVTLAPAKKLADGSTAVPWSKLSPEEQSKINAQLVQEQLKAATLLTANLGKEVAKEPEDDDPWNTPIPQTPIAEGNANDVQPPEHHVKHVDVPDVSDDVDPWATPLPTPQTDDQEQGQPNGPEQPRQNQPEQHSERHSARQSAREMQSQQAQQPASSPAGFADDPWGAPMPVQAGPPEPEVAPEDDEYSMSDESIGASNALDMNDLNRVFEVKKVEEFSSDDPHNPRNMQVKKTLDD